MILDNGFVRFKGVTDNEDSPVAAALAVMFDLPIAAQVDELEYFNEFGMYQRCNNSKYLFSRDQTIMLTTLFRLRNRSQLVSLSHVDGKDIFPPGVRGHVRRCKGETARWHQDQWLWMDVWFHAVHDPRGESNQLIAMMWFADDKFIKWWCENNQYWRESITDYFCGWRDEPELAVVMIAAIEKRIST